MAEAGYGIQLKLIIKPPPARAVLFRKVRLLIDRFDCVIIKTAYSLEIGSIGVELYSNLEKYKRLSKILCKNEAMSF